MKRNREYTCSRTEEQVKYQCYSDSHDQKNVVLSVIKHFFNLYLQFLCLAFFMDPNPDFPDPIRIRSGFLADPDPDSGKKNPIRIQTEGPGSETLISTVISISISRRGEM